MAGLAVGVFVGRERGIPFTMETRDWTLGIYEGSSPTSLRPAAGASNPVLTARDVTDLDAISVADPFMAQKDGVWYMFFEVTARKGGHKSIGMASSPDALHWTYRGIALDEPWDLSYAYVFQWAGEYYMVLEAPGSRSVPLYRASDFPLGWKHVATLVEGASFEAPSIIRRGDQWWLFAATADHSILRLFYADELTGPWTEHPQSPLIWDDPRAARCAGRVVEDGGRLIRFAQDCRKCYGEQVWAFAITELTPVAYREEPIGDAPIIGPAGGSGWNAGGMHHLDVHRVADGRWVACVDGWRTRRIYGLHY